MDNRNEFFFGVRLFFYRGYFCLSVQTLWKSTVCAKFCVLFVNNEGTFLCLEFSKEMSTKTISVLDFVFNYNAR